MPSARYEADFTQFNTAVDAASGKLLTFSKSSDWTEQTLLKTDAATKASGNSFGQLSQGLSTADKTLAAFGVHIGPEIRALEEMSLAAGKTASQIGLIGTGSLIAAAALGGWEIGKLIRDFTNLDEQFSKFIDHTFNLAVATQEAAAKQDSINLAIKRGADASITYGQAIQFNQEWVVKNSEALKAQVKATADATKATNDAIEAERRLAEQRAKFLTGIANQLFGNDDIQKAKDYMAALVSVETVTHLNNDAQQQLFDTLTKGISAMVEQGGAANELTNEMEQWRLKVIEAMQSHTVAITQMETDEERFKRENDELAKAMKDNFGVIGKAAEEAATKVSLSWSQAMDAVRAGQGTLTGTIPGIAPGTPGSTVRYDDYGNPYGYIPGVNNPGRLSPTGPRVSAPNILTATFYVNGTGQDVARVVNDELTRMMSRGGNRVGV